MAVATVRERTAKDGTVTHQVVFRLGSRQTSRTFSSDKDARKFAGLIDALGAKRAVMELEATPTGPRLDDLAVSYWAYVAGRVRSDRTVADYRRDYDNWVSPYLGHLGAATIDETDVQNWIDTIRGLTKSDGSPRLSAKSVCDRHAILHGLFKWASAPTRQHVPLGHNPCVGTDLPKRRKKPPIGLQPAEWQALHIALTQIDPDAADLALFLVATGCRWSEAVALDASCIEDHGDQMWVWIRQVARRNADAQVHVVADTKTEAGARRFKLDAEAADMVRRRATGPGLVFTTATGAMWDYGHFNSRKWAKAVKAANLRPITPHMLRHTAVGYLALSGQVSIAEIQRRIGHESIQTTIDVYGGMIEDVKDEALEFMASMRNAAPNAIDTVPLPALEK